VSRFGQVNLIPVEDVGVFSLLDEFSAILGMGDIDPRQRPLAPRSAPHGSDAVFRYYEVDDSLLVIGWVIAADNDIRFTSRFRLGSAKMVLPPGERAAP
jgi:hypothetical protein